MQTRLVPVRRGARPSAHVGWASQRHHGGAVPRGREGLWRARDTTHYCAACHHGWLKYDGRPIDVTVPTKRKRPTIRTHRCDVIERIVVRRVPVTLRVRTMGFVHPLVNAPYPGTRYVPDLWWPDQRLIVEVDSRAWHSNLLAQIDDRERQADLEARGERVLRTTKAQVRRDPGRFIARLELAGAPRR